MRVELLTIADFYSNPDEVREFAMNQDFNVTGNYPGNRTVSFLNESTKNTIQEIIQPFAGKVTAWNDTGEFGYCGAFQYTTALDRSWIHSDGTADWAGVLYLTPDAPLSAGTGIFKHKESGLTNWKYHEHTKEETFNAPHNLHHVDYTKWEIVDRVGNVYNRLILYRGDLFHVSLDYFGKDIKDGRLFQTFFFNTER